MAFYECTFITRPDLQQSDINKYVEKFSDIITNNGGEIVKTELWGLRNLAYRIKKNKKGYYVHFGLKASPAALSEMERNMKIAEDVIRHLSVKVDEINPELSAIMKQTSLNDAFLEEDIGV